MPPPKRKDPPEPPSNLTATALSPHEIHLNWKDNSQNESKFSIERAVGDGDFAFLASPDANLTEFDARQLEPNTRYRFRVRASNKGGSSPFSNISEAVTPLEPTPEPEPEPEPPATPLIWTNELARAKAKAAASDPAWLEVKTQADALLTYAVPPYHRDLAPPKSINYVWQGSGYYDALWTLSLAYHVTGNIAYATKVREVIAVIVAAGLPPLQVDSGYPSRSMVFAVALAYSWTRDAWTEPERQAVRDLAVVWHDWLSVNGYEGSGHAVYSNYFGGHIAGMGLLGEAVGNATIRDYWRAKFQFILDAFVSGVFQGGYPAESFNYGPNHFVRLLWYAIGHRDLTGEDLIAGLKPDQLLTALVEHRKPNRWQMSDEGSFSGNYTGLLTDDLATMLTAVAPDPWKGYARHWIDTHAISPAAFFKKDASLIIRVLFADASVAPMDYTAALPKALLSSGDQHLVVRTSWADDAVWVSVAANASHLGGHAQRCAGHLAIQRGTDYLLPNGGQWKGPTGIEGTPSAFDDRSYRTNTLIYPTTWGAAYEGGQGFWGKTAIIGSSVVDGGVNWIVSDLQSAYEHETQPSLTDLGSFRRSTVILTDGTVVVWDHVVGPQTKRLAWHGRNWVVAGTVATSIVGASKLTVTTLNHAGFTVTPEEVLQRLETVDAAVDAIFLHVLQPTAAGTIPETVIKDGANAVRIGSVLVTFDSNGMPTIGGVSPQPPQQFPQVSNNRRVELIAPIAGEHVLTGTTLRLIAVAQSAQAPYGGLNIPAPNTTEFLIDGVVVATVPASEAEFWVMSARSGVVQAGTHTVSARAIYDTFTIETPPATVVVDPAPAYGSTITLNGDTPPTDLVGTASARIRVNGAGHRIVGSVPSLTWRYVDFVNVGRIQVTCPALTKDHCRFEMCGTQEYAANAAVGVVDNDYASNSVFPLGQLPNSGNPSGNSFPAVKFLNGNTDIQKTLARNRFGAGWAEFSNTSKWLIQDNIGIGPRVGRFIDQSCWQFGMVSERNYWHHKYRGGWSQGNLCDGGVPQQIDQHNVLIGGSWPVRGIGELRWNLILEGGEDWIWATQNGTIHHNLCIDAENNRSGVLIYNNPTLRLHHNTFDGRGREAASMLELNNGVVTLEDSIISGSGAHAPIAILGGTLTATRGVFHRTVNPPYSDGRLVASDLFVDPQFANPITGEAFAFTAMDFNEQHVWERSLTVAQILASYRTRYTPQNPAVIGRGAIGDGGPDDRFGVVS